jgi:hypothetical protein
MKEKNVQFSIFSTRPLFFQEECPGIFLDVFSQTIKEPLEFSHVIHQIASRYRTPYARQYSVLLEP